MGYNIRMNIVQHLRDRHMNPDLYTFFADDDEGVVTFMLYNLSGQIVGYQRYRPFAPKTASNDYTMGRYFTYTAPGCLGVWGMETFYFKTDILFVTEGIFDACRIHNLGLPAVALLSNNPKGIHNWLHCLARRIVVVADNNDAGQKLMKFGHEALVVPWHAVDLGEMTDIAVKTLLHKYL